MDDQDKKDQEDLLTYCADGNEREVRQLLIRSVDCNCRDETGATPLHLAAFFNHVDITELLLKKDCDVYLTDDEDKTAIDDAKSAGNTECIELIEMYIAKRQKTQPEVEAARQQVAAERQSMKQIIEQRQKIQENLMLSIRANALQEIAKSKEEERRRIEEQRELEQRQQREEEEARQQQEAEEEEKIRAQQDQEAAEEARFHQIKGDGSKPLILDVVTPAGRDNDSDSDSSTSSVDSDGGVDQLSALQQPGSDSTFAQLETVVEDGEWWLQERTRGRSGLNVAPILYR